jgi:Trk K+ transport system NAD-binding subunit
MVLLAAFAVAAKLGQRAGRSGGLNRVLEELSHATSQIKVRGAFAMMVIWVVLAEMMGVELILGAFLAGAILSVSSRDSESQLREKLDAIGYGFFIPIFFITVGAQFDVGALLGSRSALLLVPVLIVSAYAVKVLPALFFRSLFTWREVFGAGVLLSSRLSLIIAASAIALDLELITSAVNSAVILVAVVTCTFSPILFSKILPPTRAKRREGVVILGTDQLAALLGQRLRKRGERVTFIGRDQEQLELLRGRGFEGIMGNPDDPDVLHAAGLEKARALIALTNAPDVVVSVCRTAVQRYEVPAVIARVDDPQRAAELAAMDVRVVQPGMAVALALEGALHFPAAFGMLEDQDDDVEMGDVILRNGSIAGNPLRRIRLPGNALVVGVRRRGEVMVPHGDTVVRLDDTLVLVGSRDGLEEAQRELGGFG